MTQEKRKLTAEDVKRLPNPSLDNQGPLCEVNFYNWRARRNEVCQGVAQRSSFRDRVCVRFLTGSQVGNFHDYLPEFVTIHEPLPAIASVAEPDSASPGELSLAPA